MATARQLCGAKLNSTQPRSEVLIGFEMAFTTLRRHRRHCQAVGALAFLVVASAGHAQDAGTVRRIGFIGMDSRMQAARFEAFREGMRQQGYLEGRNLVPEVAGHRELDRVDALADELVRRARWRSLSRRRRRGRAAKNATEQDPDRDSRARSGGDAAGRELGAHPAGNITGIAFQDA